MSFAFVSFKAADVPSSAQPERPTIDRHTTITLLPYPAHERRFVELTVIQPLSVSFVTTLMSVEDEQEVKAGGVEEDQRAADDYDG